MARRAESSGTVYTRTQSFEMLGYLAVHYAVRKP